MIDSSHFRFIHTSIDDIQASDIPELQDLVRHHRELYNREQPIISDFEYDHLYRLLVEGEKKFHISDSSSPTQEVDHLVSSQFRKATHAHPMASLDNTYNADDLLEFEKRIGNMLKKDSATLQHCNTATPDYMVELKFDGLGVALTYEDGKLIRGLTRGNGIQGEDITINLMQINSIPKTIPERVHTVEIRGEVVMPTVSFEELNDDRMKSGQQLFANPRNAASGSVRQKNWQVTASRKLDFFAYSCPFLEIQNADPSEPKKILKYESLIETLETWGFHITPYFKKFHGIQEVIHEIESMNGKPRFPFEIDGLVIKVNDLRIWQILGSTAHHPRSAISYKFPAEYSRTKIESIQHSVGRTGTVTPVANVEPVNIGGAVIRRATLHNYEDMENKGVMIGDQVWIHRAGEVIPEIIGPIIEARNGSQQNIIIPSNCPICETKLEKDDDKVAIYCPNAHCPAKVTGGLEWFVSKHGLDIDGLGPQQVALFMEKGWVTDSASIFDLAQYEDEILGHEGYKEKAVTNLIEAIEEAKQQPVWRFLSSLGIAGVGKRTAKTIAHLFTCDNDFLLFQKTAEELEEIRDIGPETAQNIIEYFNTNQSLIKRLLDRIKIEYATGTLEYLNTGTLDGKSFCVTGSFDSYSRDQIHDIIEQHGGEVRTSVSAKLDYLIAGNNAGSKRAKAESLGAFILSLDQFFELVR